MHAFLFLLQSVKCRLYAGSSRIDSGKNSSCDRPLAPVVIVQRSAPNSSSCLALGVAYLVQCHGQMTTLYPLWKIGDASKKKQKEEETDE